MKRLSTALALIFILAVFAVGAYIDEAGRAAPATERTEP